MNTLHKFMFGAILLSSGTLLHAQTAVAPAEPVAPVAVAAPMAEVATMAEVAPVAEEAPIDRSTLKYSNKWRIGFDNRADSSGVLSFRITEKDAEPLLIDVSIKKGTSENNIADAVKLALRKALPKNFKTEGDDGDDVLVKHNFAEGRFSLELLSNSVEDLDVSLSKE